VPPWFVRVRSGVGIAAFSAIRARSYPDDRVNSLLTRYDICYTALNAVADSNNQNAWTEVDALNRCARFPASVRRRAPHGGDCPAGLPGTESVGVWRKRRTPVWKVALAGPTRRVRRSRQFRTGRRAAVQQVRVHHDPQRELLQVQQLRHDVRPRVIRSIDLQADPSRLREAFGGASRSAFFCIGRKKWHCEEDYCLHAPRTDCNPSHEPQE
jgi:hypothetical protein